MYFVCVFMCSLLFVYFCLCALYVIGAMAAVPAH